MTTWKPETLRAAMDKARAMPGMPPDRDAAGKIMATHCNLNAAAVAKELGLYNAFIEKTKGRIMLANEMFSYMAAAGSGYRRAAGHREAWEAANAGRLVFAAQDNPSGHGHIAPVYPSKGMVLSGHWGKECPYVSNVGKTVGVMGANYAFAKPPTYFIYDL